MTLDGSIALVTGVSHDAGIGVAVCHELAYGATMGAVSAFTLSLSAELASAGITVNAVNSGPTDTGWMTDEIKKHLEPKVLSGRMGMPEDAARLITFLVTEEDCWITDQVINSEGRFLRSKNRIREKRKGSTLFLSVHSELHISSVKDTFDVLD